jgi:transposase-like protein
MLVRPRPIGRLKDAWSDERARWSKRDLSGKRYVYFWADGIHVRARLEDDAQCLLLIIGATPEGKGDSLPPEILEPVRRQGRIDRRARDRAMTERQVSLRLPSGQRP